MEARQSEPTKDCRSRISQLRLMMAESLFGPRARAGRRKLPQSCTDITLDTKAQNPVTAHGRQERLPADTKEFSGDPRTLRRLRLRTELHVQERAECSTMPFPQSRC